MNSPILDFNGQEIAFVKLHGKDAFVKDIGGLGDTLPHLSKSLDLKMYHTPTGVLAFVKLKPKGVTKRFTIPWANVQLAEYLDEKQAASLAVVSPENKSA